MVRLCSFESISMFIVYKVKIKNQLKKNIKIQYSDQGREYESNEFSELCTIFGIIHQTTAPHTPQQNEIVERKNRTLKDMVNSMLVSSSSPQNFVGGSPINRKSGYPTRNLVLFHLSCGTEDDFSTITSKCGVTLQRYQCHYLRRLSWDLKWWTTFSCLE